MVPRPVMKVLRQAAHAINDDATFFSLLAGVFVSLYVVAALAWWWNGLL